MTKMVSQPFAPPSLASKSPRMDVAWRQNSRGQMCLTPKARLQGQCLCTPHHGAITFSFVPSASGVEWIWPGRRSQPQLGNTTVCITFIVEADHWNGRLHHRPRWNISSHLGVHSTTHSSMQSKEARKLTTRTTIWAPRWQRVYQLPNSGVHWSVGKSSGTKTVGIEKGNYLGTRTEITLPEA